MSQLAHILQVNPATPSHNRGEKLAIRSNLLRVTDATFEDRVRSLSKPYLLLFESRFDIRTKEMVESLTRTVKRRNDDVVGMVAIVEEAESLCERFKVAGVPTLIVGESDRELGQILGLKTEEELYIQIDRFLPATDTNSC